MTRQRSIMGDLVDRGFTAAVVSVVGMVIIGLNIFLICDQVTY